MVKIRIVFKSGKRWRLKNRYGWRKLKDWKECTLEELSWNRIGPSLGEDLRSER